MWYFILRLLWAMLSTETSSLCLQSDARSWCIFIFLCLQNFKLQCHILLGHCGLAGIRKQCFLWYDLSDHAVSCLLCRCLAMTQLQRTVSAFWIFWAIRFLISITRSRRYIYIQHKCMAKSKSGVGKIQNLWVGSFSIHELECELNWPHATGC